MDPSPEKPPPAPSPSSGPAHPDAERGVRSFRFLVPTQFLGAFNDNAFKQLILLVAVDLTGRGMAEGGTLSYQAIATGLFALPFVLFSGIAGSLADRYSKTHIIVWAKVAEIAVMLLGAVGFWLGDMNFLLFTVFLMGTQSAFFGPAKYGILPEMLSKSSLSRGNGVIMMTTFLAIILGMAAAGALRDTLPDALHLAAAVYVALAALGTACALGIARMPPARPGLPVRGRPMGDLASTFVHIFRDPNFLLVICVYSFFWFLGAVVQQTLNVYGRELMGLSNRDTSLLLGTLSVGMALGGILGGLLSRRTINFQLTRWGLWGVVLTLAVLTQAYRWLFVLHAALLLLGMSGSLFGLPLQTFIQHYPPEEEKGRFVAAANFSNWVFILLSAAYFQLMRMSLATQWVPGSLAVITLILGIYMRPRLAALQRTVG